MRRFGRLIIWTALILAMVLTVALFTMRWWVTSAANAVLPGFLENVPVEELDVSVRQLGLAESQLEIKRIRAGAITVTDTTIDVDYAIEQLERKSVDQVDIRHPQVSIDLAMLNTTSAKTDGQPFDFQARLPLRQLTVSDGRLTLVAGDWTREFKTAASITDNERTRFNLNASNGIDELSLEGVASIPKQSGQLRAKLSSKDMVGWLPLAKFLQLPTPPNLDQVQLSEVSLRADAQLRDSNVGAWEMTGQIAGLKAPWESWQADVATATMSAKGNALKPDSFELDATEAVFAYDQLKLLSNALQLHSNDHETLAASTGGWQLKGKTAIANLGDVSGKGGEITARLLGPWTTLAEGMSPSDWGLELDSAPAPFSFYSGLGSLTGDLRFRANVGSGESRNVKATVKMTTAEAAVAGVSFESEQVDAAISGHWPGTLTAGMKLAKSAISWGDAGRIDGLVGRVAPVKLFPLAIDEPQELTFESFSQGGLSASEGRLVFTYAPRPSDGQLVLSGNLEANALSGSMTLFIKGNLNPPRTIEVRAKLDGVSLEQLGNLLPKFDGRVTGKVSGELAFRLEGKKLILSPGYLQMTPNTTGRFQFYKQGWMTQDPNLNPVNYVKDKDLVTLLKGSNGAAIVTELAMRDLLMTNFRLDVLKPGEGDKQVIIKIEGEGDVKGVKVPVVLDVPVSGDVRETLNLILKLQSQR